MPDYLSFLNGPLGVVVSSALVAMLFVEVIKWVWRKFVVKDMTYDFPVLFYVLSVPLLNQLAMPLLAWLGVEGYTLPTDLLQFIKELILLLLASAGSYIGYNTIIKPLKSYSKTLTK